MSAFSTPTQADPAPVPFDPIKRARLELLVAALETVDGGSPQVLAFDSAAGGNSHECWIARVRRDGAVAVTTVVLRCDPDDWIRAEEMRREEQGMRIAAYVDLPAPRLIATDADAGARADRPFVVVDFVAGESIARRIHREPTFESARSMFATQCGTILAQLHSAPSELVAELDPRDPILEIRGRYAKADTPNPVLAGVVEWLAQNRPDPIADVAVHGDFRLGNMIVDATGIAAVLDWETTHRGDPYEDLAWVCQRAWRYGGPFPVGGLGSREQMFQAYQDTTATPIDLDRFHWWSVWGATFWALASRELTAVTRSTAGDAMETAAIARQVCVQEATVLEELRRFLP